ncbi:MAG: XRE family transcriptional regulator, partial [Acidobacteriota bacterium]
TLTVARPLSLTAGANSSVGLGLRLDDLARQRIAFVDDPDIMSRDVSLTCERCPIADCDVRAGEPTVREAAEHQARRLAAVGALAAELQADAN